MSVPVHSLRKDQKIWYARFVIGAILADDEISPSEVDFLKQVINIVDDPHEKRELMQMISSKKCPPLTPPQGISKEILAAIFIELILIMISDLDFAESEKVYLQNVSRLFNFDESYFAELMHWGEEGVKWKDDQRFLVSDDGDVESFHVPLDKLNSEQKGWYAKSLIATIMLDGLVDDTELQFLKAAMSFVDNKKEQHRLVGYVRNKMAPPLTSPPGISQDILLLIFFEVILIVSADESLSYKEQTHLKHIAEMCDMSDAFLDKAIDWCHRGISWKQNKNPLIARCKLGSRIQSLQAHGPLELNPDNNSILNRDLECYICESSTKVKGFQLKPHSQEPNRNIFGITTYLESLGGQDYIDFNLIKVLVCPNCFFASVEKDMFRKNSNDPAPKALKNQLFKTLWLRDADQRKSKFKDHMEEISSIKRTLPTVIKTYKLAIKVYRVLGKMNQDQSFDWQVVTLLLTLSEILMSNGKEKKANEYLEQARVAADDLFKNASNNLIAIRSARLLFFIALYHNDIRVAGPFVDYVRRLYLDNSDSLNPAELTVLKKVYGETKQALKNRADYRQERLYGFHLAI